MAIKGAPFHYIGCGLDDVYLANGFEIMEDAAGRPTVQINYLDKLHEALGKALVDRKESLSGKEIRFLRTEMLMTQSILAKLLQVSEQSVHRWENGKSDIPKPAETLLRLLYREHINEASTIQLKAKLEKLADLENALDDEGLNMNMTDEGWRLAA